MSRDACIILQSSGLGDRLTDILGFYVICKCLNYNPKVFFNNTEYWFPWGVAIYDLRLFDFVGIELVENTSYPFMIKSPNPSSSLSPYKAYEFVSKFIPELSFETFSGFYHSYAKEVIRPSEIIQNKIPINIEKAYGIHLRRTDKVGEYISDIRHENTISEYDLIIKNLLEDVTKIIQTEEEPVFLIVSEDNYWKDEFHHIVNRIFLDNNKTPRFIGIDYNTNMHYTNYNGILDMFCLSKCKEILQGVKYSTFSIIASLIGENKLRNYFTPTDDKCLAYSYHSAIEMNGSKNYDKDMYKKIFQLVEPLQTNISSI
jgi:hypothetical protein